MTTRTLKTLVLALATLSTSLAAQLAPSTAPAVNPIPQITTRGTGPTPIILIPGLSCDATVFDSFMARNDKLYTMYAVTLAGNGNTPALNDPHDPVYEHTPWLNEVEDALVKLVAEKHLDRPVIAGHSLGGFLALRASTDHPGLFRAAISLDGYPAFPMQANMTAAQRAEFVNTRLSKTLTGNAAAFAARQRTNVANMVTNPKRAEELGDVCARTPAEVTVRYLLEVVSADITAQVQATTTPTLAITAVTNASPEATAKSQHFIHTTFDPAKNIIVIEFIGSRHFVQDDAPAALDKAVADFLNHAPPTTQVSVGAPTTQPQP